MGDRISIRFVNGEDKSVYLFSHWGGMFFKGKVDRYVNNLKRIIKMGWENSCGTPLKRLEPDTVMVDFIRHITKDMEIADGDLYLRGEEDGDNSDNGLFDINLAE